MFFAAAKLFYFLLRPLNVLILLLLAGALARIVGWRRLAAGLIGFAVLWGIAFGLSPLPNALTAVLEERFSAPTASTPAPDVILVLGGSIQTLVSGTRAGVLALGESAERLTDVPALARRFPKAQIVFTGGSADVVDGFRSEAAVARDLFVSFGIDPARMLFEDRSRDTYENAIFTRALRPPKPGETWWLVTSATHMPRSIGVFRAAGWDRLVAYPVDFRSIDGPLGWLPEMSAVNGFALAETSVKEVIGLVAYRLTGRTGEWFPAPQPLP